MVRNNVLVGAFCLPSSAFGSHYWRCFFWQFELGLVDPSLRIELLPEARFQLIMYRA
jgi:hypothetical protein